MNGVNGVFPSEPYFLPASMPLQCPRVRGPYWLPGAVRRSSCDVRQGRTRRIQACVAASSGPATLDSAGVPLRHSGALLNVGPVGSIALGVGSGNPVRSLLPEAGREGTDERFVWSPVARSLVWRQVHGLLVDQKEHSDSLGFGLGSLRLRYHRGGNRWNGGTPGRRLQRSRPLLRPGNVVVVEAA